MPPPKTHPNNGATMWASIPDNLVPKFNNAVLAINSQVPSDYVVYVIAPDPAGKKGNASAEAARAKEAFEAAFSDEKGVKFRPEYVETWHARHIPGNSVVIGNHPWDKHPLFAGPEDTKVFVYIPKLAEEKVEEARQKEWAEKEKAKIAAKAAKDQQAVDGALAAGGPADPTLPIDDPTPAPKKTTARKSPAKKAASKKGVV